MSIAEAQAVAEYLDIDGDGMIEAEVMPTFAIPPGLQCADIVTSTGD